MNLGSRRPGCSAAAPTVDQEPGGNFPMRESGANGVSVSSVNGEWNVLGTSVPESRRVSTNVRTETNVPHSVRAAMCAAWIVQPIIGKWISMFLRDDYN